MIRRSFVSVLKDRRGAVAIVMAFTLPVVIGAAGLGIEAGTWYLVKRQAQTAADTGAFAGALELAAGISKSTAQETMKEAARQAAVQEASRNGFTEGGNLTVQVNIPPTSGLKAGKPNAVEVILTRDEPLLFAALFLSEPTEIVARAVGFVKDTGDACVLALNPSPKKEGLAVTGNGTVILEDCSLASNSTKSNSLAFTGSGTVEVPSVWSAGGLDMGHNQATADIPISANTYAWALTDPYADLTIPTPLPACDFDGYKAKGNVTLTPGVYCNGLDLGSNDITLNPGTYYIDKGDLSATGGSITCNCTTPGSGVTIVLTSSGNANKIGDVKINGNVTMTLRAPSVSEPTAQYPFPGVLFFQDRRAPESGGDGVGFSVKGGAVLSLDGALYFPNRKVVWSGNSGSDACTRIVAGTVEITGTSTLTSTGCNKFGLDPITVNYSLLVE